MPVLSRYDDSEDDVVAAPARRSGAWRYDETSDSVRDSGSDSTDDDDELSEPLRCVVVFTQAFRCGKQNIYKHCSEQNKLRSESGSADSPRKTSTVDLQLVSLQSLQHLGGSGDASSFAKHGLDRKRIRATLKDPPCTCGCSVPEKVLLKTCQAFWSLPKESQDAVLWSLQCETGRKIWKIEGKVLKTFEHIELILNGWCCLVFAVFPPANLHQQAHWCNLLALAGHHVCRTAWLRFLGIGKQRLSRTGKRFRGIDDRTLYQGTLFLCFLTHFVLMFFTPNYPTKRRQIQHNPTQVEPHIQLLRALRFIPFLDTCGGQLEKACLPSC